MISRKTFKVRIEFLFVANIDTRTDHFNILCSTFYKNYIAKMKLIH